MFSAYKRRRAAGALHGQGPDTRRGRPPPHSAWSARRSWPSEVEHVNRIKGVVFAQGVSDYEPLKRNCLARLEELKTGDCRLLSAHLKA